jgi:hypothetical protein
MTNHIIPKIAYISLEYSLSVNDFLVMWEEMEEDGEATQKDYDMFTLSYGKEYFYDMRGELENHIRLMEDN